MWQVLGGHRVYVKWIYKTIIKKIKASCKNNYLLIQKLIGGSES